MSDKAYETSIKAKQGDIYTKVNEQIFKAIFDNNVLPCNRENFVEYDKDSVNVEVGFLADLLKHRRAMIKVDKTMYENIISAFIDVNVPSNSMWHDKDNNLYASSKVLGKLLDTNPSDNKVLRELLPPSCV